MTRFPRSARGTRQDTNSERAQAAGKQQSEVAAARISAGWALLFIALLYTTAPAVAAFARTNLLTTLSEQPYSETPTWFSNSGKRPIQDLVERIRIPSDAGEAHEIAA